MTRAKDISKIVSDADFGGTLDVAGVVTANAGVVVDNITIDGTTIALSSGDLTIDVEGTIILDGDEAGATVHLKDGGTHWGSIYRSDSNFNIESEASDKDIVFKGNDGGSGITALTLDMSAGGEAKFNDNIVMGTSGKGIHLGVTSATATNLLDDYEEGAYDVTVACSTSGTITLHSGFNSASYTKVGNLVHVSGLLNVGSVSSPSGLFSLSLPFTSANLEERRADSTASLYITGVVDANVSDFVASINENTAVLSIQMGDNISPQNDSAEQIRANVNMVFSATYRTA